jgi:DNA ligase-1
LLLRELVDTSAAVSSTTSRKAKIEAIAVLLRRASADEVATTISYLSGDLPQRRAGVGWASLRAMPPAAPAPTLTIGDTDAALSRIAAEGGSGSAARRQDELQKLLQSLTTEEQRFVSSLIGGELRQGALAGIMVDAVGAAAGVDVDIVRRAAMLSGSLPLAGAAVLSQGPEALDGFRLQVGIAVQPMLAQTASSVESALARTGPASIEWKLDGIRVQVHRQAADVRVFTRTLDEITDRAPEIVETALSLSVDDVILDGETIALRPDGRPRPFQETGSRVASRGNVADLRRRHPLTTFFFDVLHVDGTDLIDRPLSARLDVARAAVGPELLVPRIATEDAVEAEAFLAGALERGHEGVLVKSLSSTYEAGRRGAGWIKVKPHHTLDLVVLAAEWGHGRRHGRLSNLHLGARDPQTDTFVMLGKTFKGLTDAMLEWQTKRLLEIESRRDSWTVYVRPELVVEIAFDGLQRSSRYPGGVALRFARVVRYREDKSVEEADTVATVLDLYGGATPEETPQ